MSKTIIMMAGRSPVEEIGGGHGAYVRSHARAATAAGYNVHLYCASATRSDTCTTPYGEVHHVAASGVPTRQRYIATLAGPLAAAVLRDRDIWSRAAALHSFGVWAYAGSLAVERLATQRPLRHVMSMYTVYREESVAQLRAIRGVRLRLRLRRLVEWLHILLSVSRRERHAYRACDTVAVNYHCMRELVLRRLGQHHDLRVVPYGPELAFVDPRARPRDRARSPGRPPLVMTIALQRPKKGVRTLLEALAMLRRDGVPFRGWVVGGGEDREDNIRSLRVLGLEGVVEFPGFVEAIEPWLDIADIYVQPSIREESGSLALLEAMACGVPVICSAVDGMAEDVRDGVDGLTCAPGDARALAERIGRLVEDGGERQRLATAGAVRFAERHGKDVVIRALRCLYEPEGPGPE